MDGYERTRQSVVRTVHSMMVGEMILRRKELILERCGTGGKGGELAPLGSVLLPSSRSASWVRPSFDKRRSNVDQTWNARLSGSGKGGDEGGDFLLITVKQHWVGEVSVEGFELHH